MARSVWSRIALRLSETTRVVRFPYVLKKLFAASFDARFLAIAACSRSISDVISAMRSASSSTESSDRSCPDLVGDFLPRLVVILDGHALLRARRPREAVASRYRAG